MSLRLARTVTISNYSRRVFARHRSDVPFVLPTKEFKVLLDNQTLYIDRDLAVAMGWKAEQESVNLRLAGWEPSCFTITPAGTDSDHLSQATVESSRNPNVKKVLDYLK